MAAASKLGHRSFLVFWTMPSPVVQSTAGFDRVSTERRVVVLPSAMSNGREEHGHF